PPEIYVAALKLEISERAAIKADGLLLNFCSPQHAARLIQAVRIENGAGIDFACYMKIFYSSQSDKAAQRLMLQEFLNYDSTPQYHEMVVQDGTAKALSTFRENEGWKSGQVDEPKELLRESMANGENDDDDP